ncbi:MAG: primosomal protein N' [Holosporales bacterium]|nr:primosomal protein N' [Holosporales bacterium]
MKYGVAILLNLNKVYTYSHSESIEKGQLVAVPLRNREILGIVVDIYPEDASSDCPPGKPIKPISSLLPYSIPESYISFAEFVSDYYLNSIGGILKLVVPFSIDALLSQENPPKIQTREVSKIELNADQLNAVDKIIQRATNGFRTTLLHGITGSGKTEVFLEIAKNRMPADGIGHQILILVPEVSLSSELSKKVADRIGIEVFIWHNSISKSKKLKIWRMAVSGKSIAVVGARSALFIPFQNLGTIIVDEEHDSSLKQNESPIYNARDMAVYLGRHLGIPVLLSSATPSIESYNNAQSGKYEYIKLSSRYFENAKLPEVTINDLRKEKLDGCLSKYAIEKIHEYLHAEKQILIFVNRRGHTPKVLCKACGWKVTCPGCSAWLCYHHHSSEFICHYCGYKTYIRQACEECGSQKLVGIGIGIEKAYEECKQLFPEARISILSSDTMNTPNKISKAIEDIKRKRIDIILGTQIVAKGHNFDALNLVVITCIDAMMYGEDFRSLERAFQTLYQVSGRAGRTGDSRAEVVIQTYCPNDELMKIIKNNDIERMYTLEIRNRQLLKMPPFGNMASITMSALSEKEVVNFAKELVSKAPKLRGVKILGPLYPVIFKIRSRYRLRIIAIQKGQLQGYIRSWILSNPIPRNIKLTIDIDPYDFN